MTHVRQTHHQDVNSPSQIAGVPLSVLAQMLRDRERREQIAARIRQLWEESGYTEPEIAEKIGLSLRGYQKAKQTGGISREKLEKLAELHNVTVEWILTGRERGQTPDALASLNGDVSADLDKRLSAIEEKIEQLLVLTQIVAAEQTERTAETAPPSGRASSKPAKAATPRSRRRAT